MSPNRRMNEKPASDAAKGNRSSHTVLICHQGRYALFIAFLLMNFSFILIEGTGLLPDNPGFSATQKRILARRAAIVDAYRNFLIRQSRFDENNWHIKPYQQINISGKITGARVVRTLNLKDRVIVTISAPNRFDQEEP